MTLTQANAARCAQMVLDLARAEPGYASDIAVAVVDRHGEQRLFVADDMAAPLPSRLAVRKARTAALMRRSTAIVAADVSDGRVVLASLNDVELLAMPGGVPLRQADGTLVGGIGVSGLAPDMDARLAEVAAGAFASGFVVS